MNHIDVKFMKEKREGHGEDSDPLHIVKDNFCAVGVFDGMGGSGAATCKSDFGDGHTKAYVASRIIKEAVENYINNSTSDICSDGMQNITKSRLEKEKKNFPAKASGLRSKLVREYPTTLAVITCKENEDGSSIINSYWAGDSRNYLWNGNGFFQISKDELDTELDPLENLHNDGALSNCICADRAFHISHKSFKEIGKFIILSATDGCFGYFPTPMHFHDVLLSGLKKSENEKEWESFIKEKISDVTGDDISLSLCAIGYKDFCSLKTAFENEIITGFDELENLRKEITSLEILISKKKASLEDTILLGWKTYKSTYMKYIDGVRADGGNTSEDHSNSSELDHETFAKNMSEHEAISPSNTPTSDTEPTTKEGTEKETYDIDRPDTPYKEGCKKELMPHVDSVSNTELVLVKSTATAKENVIAKDLAKEPEIAKDPEGTFPPIRIGENHDIPDIPEHSESLHDGTVDDKTQNTSSSLRISGIATDKEKHTLSSETAYDSGAATCGKPTQETVQPSNNNKCDNLAKCKEKESIRNSLRKRYNSLKRKFRKR